jgi:hypothetical protein
MKGEMEKRPELFVNRAKMMAVESVKVEHIEKILSSIGQLACSKLNRVSAPTHNSSDGTKKGPNISRRPMILILGDLTIRQLG